LLRASAAAGAAATLGGCGATYRVHKPLADAIADRDVALLNDALWLERRAITAYTAGIPLLEGYDRRVATEFLKQELGHAGRLLVLIKTAGGPANAPAPSYDLGEPQSRKQVLELLRRVEQAQIAGYLNAIGVLSPGQLRAAAASILADHAQHISILRSVLGTAPVPSAFVSGRE
jgi:hypothetical protein